MLSPYVAFILPFVCTMHCLLQALEQDRYSLNLRLSQQLKMSDSYQEEIDSLRTQLANERQSILEQANAEYTGKITQLQKQVLLLTSKQA
jgi:hypothetical protein